MNDSVISRGLAWSEIKKVGEHALKEEDKRQPEQLPSHWARQGAVGIGLKMDPHVGSMQLEQTTWILTCECLTLQAPACLPAMRGKFCGCHSGKLSRKSALQIPSRWHCVVVTGAAVICPNWGPEWFLMQTSRLRCLQTLRMNIY